MNSKVILIVLGEPYSIFSEILGKSLFEKKKFKNKIILIGNFKLLKKQLKKLKYQLNINLILDLKESLDNKINMIDVDFEHKKIFSKITDKSNKYIENSFKKALDIIKKNNKDFVLINGPISKKSFLQYKYLGITEYLSKKTKSKDEIMLIYNNNLSVSPLTTHIPLKKVSNKINKDKIYKNVLNIHSFYKNALKKKAKFAILGLNPHCETTDNYSEEEKIIKPVVKNLISKGINIKGPFPTDTFFLDKNLKKFNVVIGMYHDQVLTPIKTIYKFNAINITLGLPFIRISPDHGPNTSMLGKNRSDPSSFKYALKFIEKLK